MTAAQLPAHQYRWRPSMFVREVTHIAIEGQTRRTSEDYPGERWVWAACGQKVRPDEDEPVVAQRCPECLAWLRDGRPNTTKSPRSAGPKPDGAGA
jgi:hypothetical protein